MKKILSYGLTSLVISCLSIAAYHFSGIGKQVVRVEQENPTPAVTARHVSYDFPEGYTPPDFRLAAERAMSAVVHIKTYHRVIQRRSDPFYDFFGYRPRHQNRESISTGSGVIIDSKGYIVTNNHVVKGADKIEVTLFDNRSYPATLIGTDPSTDLGLLRIEADNLPTVAFANSDEAQVGQWVLAVGNPFNLASTATAGIVSAIGRDLEIIKDEMAIESFIQTDAAVNPGNSGGALVNLQGKLMGINTAIASPTGVYAGYAFAVPANIVSKVIDDLRDYGTVQRGFFGLAFYRNLNTNISKELGLNITEGVLVDRLYAEGAAQKAGIKTGDVIVQIDNHEVKNDAKMLELEGRYRPGDEVSMIVNRAGKRKSFTLKLTNQYGTTKLLGSDRNEVLSQLGIELKDLPQRFLDKYGMDSGVYISKIVPGKISQSTKMRENFIVLRVDDREATSSADLLKYFENAKGNVKLEGFYEGDRYIYSYNIEL